MSYFDILMDAIKQDIETAMAQLRRGTGSFEKDQRIRGELDGLESALQRVEEVIQRAKRAANEE